MLVLDEDETRQVLNIRPALVDNDSDGLTDAEEVELGSDPYSADTDGDGLPDLTEVNAGTNPPKLIATAMASVMQKTSFQLTAVKLSIATTTG